MRIVLFTGGARSGKSRAAVERARELGGDAVSFLATGRAEDDEMARRIERHRAERPARWETIEASGEGAAALARARHAVIVLDCLTFLVSDALSAYAVDDPEAALAGSDDAVGALLRASRRREGSLVVVTNEVGSGVVPATALGRVFRDAQGRANQRVAEAAEEVVLFTAGIPLRLK